MERFTDEGAADLTLSRLTSRSISIELSFDDVWTDILF